MSYKIKFLSHFKRGEYGDEMNPVYHTQNFSDGGEIEKIAQRFKAMGFKRVETIEVGKGSKYSAQEVIMLFYPDKNYKGETINPHELEIREKLLSSVEGEKTDKESEVEKRKALFVKAGELFEAGFIDKAPAKNIKTEDLEKLVTEAEK